MEARISGSKLEALGVIAKKCSGSLCYSFADDFLGTLETLPTR